MSNVWIIIAILGGGAMVTYTTVTIIKDYLEENKKTVVIDTDYIIALAQLDKEFPGKEEQ